MALKPRRGCSIAIHHCNALGKAIIISIFSMIKRFIHSCILERIKKGVQQMSGKYTPLTIQYTNGT